MMTHATEPMGRIIEGFGSKLCTVFIVSPYIDRRLEFLRSIQRARERHARSYAPTIIPRGFIVLDGADCSVFGA